MSVVDLSLSIPEAGLEFSAGQRESLSLTVEAIDEAKEPLEKRTTTLVLPPLTPHEENESAPRRWIRLHVPWHEEFAGLRVRLEDLGAIKAPLFSRIRREHPYGELAARVALPPRSIDGGAPELSGLLFARGGVLEPTAEGTPGLRAVRTRLDPNPDRHYGRDESILTVYWERYPGARLRADTTDSANGTDGGVVAATYRVEIRPSAGGEAVTSKEYSEAVASSRPSWHMRRFDLSPLPAGTYEFRIAWSEPGRETLVTSGAFQVLWDLALQELDDAELLVFARVLLPPDEFESFEKLDRGGREAAWRALWGDAGAGRTTHRSELEERFYDRVELAEARYGGHRRGILTDRGRTLVRLGEPDEIRFELNPQDEELLWRILPQEIEGLPEDAAMRERQTRHRTPLDNRAYEIWSYSGRGDPLFGATVNPGGQMGFKFIFVDEMGVGDYTLVYTNLASQY